MKLKHVMLIIVLGFLLLMATFRLGTGFEDLSGEPDVVTLTDGEVIK